MKKLTVFIVVTLLAMHLISCATTKTEVKTIVPEIVFPIFPELNEYRITDEGVIVPTEWIIRVAEYTIQIDETEKNYVQIKELYENEFK